jgi:hypothetical protein
MVQVRKCHLHLQGFIKMQFVQLFVRSPFLSLPYSQCALFQLKIQSQMFLVTTCLQGPWLNVAPYCCKDYSVIEYIVKGFDSYESSSIRIVKELLSRSLSVNLAYIKFSLPQWSSGNMLAIGPNVPDLKSG